MAALAERRRAAMPSRAEETPAERIRRSAAEQLARHDAAVRGADIRPGDPIEPVLIASRGLIEWTAEVASGMAESARPLSPETERALAERLGGLAGAAVKSEAWRFSQGALARILVLAGAGLAIVFLAAFAAGYQLGVHGSVVTVQIHPGEVVGTCQSDTIRPAPDGQGRICSVWVRLDQARLVGGTGR
ncbi:MAG: hypothetical protein JOZ05_06590 [Acetobacteraceae bacterium]|nr:hypothetical protein [Acetobacteraceae bacterium]